MIRLKFETVYKTWFVRKDQAKYVEEMAKARQTTESDVARELLDLAIKLNQLNESPSNDTQAA